MMINYVLEVWLQVHDINVNFLFGDEKNIYSSIYFFIYCLYIWWRVLLAQQKENDHLSKY